MAAPDSFSYFPQITMLKQFHKSTFIIPTIIALSLFVSGCYSSAAPQKVGKNQLSRAPYIQNSTTRTLDIVWETGGAGTAFLQYKLQSGKTDKSTFTQANTVTLAKAASRHVVHLVNLKPASNYDYRVGTQGKVLFTGVFQTNKTAAQNYQFDVWGDSGSGNTGQKKLAAQIDQSKPDFILHTGDLIYPKGQASGFNPYFFHIYQKVLSRVPFYGSLGNHDVRTDNGKPWRDAFILPRNGPKGLVPESNYYVDYANARIAVINSNLDTQTLQNKVASWLTQIMTSSKATWKFAVMHHPAYSSGPHGDTARIQKVLSPVFAKVGIDVVFAGHDHQYERFKPINGVTYIVTGAGGAGRYPRLHHNPQTAIYWNKDWSFTKIKVSHKDGNDVLQGTQIDTTGKVVDKWSLNKPS